MQSKTHSSLNEYERFSSQQDKIYSTAKKSTIVRLKNSHVTDKCGFTDSIAY
jgi:hypothetical protein